MLPVAYDFLAGIIAVGVPIYVVRTLRRRTSPQRDLFLLVLCVQVFYGAAAILYFPTTETAIGRLTGITPLSLWMSNMCSLISGYCCVLFFWRLVHGVERALPLLWRWMVGTMIAMTICLVWAGRAVAYNGQPVVGFSLPLLLYRLLDIVYLGYCEAQLIVLWRNQIRVTTDNALRLGLLLFSAGSYLSFGWLALNIPLALTPLHARDATELSWWYGTIFVLMGWCFMFGSLIPLAGMRTSQLGSPWRTVIAYYRLQRLWRDVTLAVPQVVLPVTMDMRDALWHSADLDLLLYRRVIELLDAWRHLDISPHPEPLASLAEMDRATWQRWATEDAQTLRDVLMGRPPTAPQSMHLPERYADLVRYMELVSRAYRQMNRQVTKPSAAIGMAQGGGH